MYFADFVMDKENICPLVTDLPIITLKDLELPAELSRKRSLPSPIDSSSSSADQSKSTTPEDITEFLSRKRTAPKMYSGAKKSKGTFEGLKLADYPKVKHEMKAMSANQLMEFVAQNPELSGKAEKVFKKIVKEKYPAAKRPSGATWKAVYELLKEHENDEKVKKQTKESVEKKKKEEEERLEKYLETRRTAPTTTARVRPNLPGTMALRETYRAQRQKEVKMETIDGEPKKKKMRMSSTGRQNLYTRLRRY